MSWYRHKPPKYPPHRDPPPSSPYNKENKEPKQQ